MHEHHVVSDHNGVLLSHPLRCCFFCIQHGERAKCVCPLVSHARQAHLIIQLFISIFAINEGEKRLTAKQVQGFCTSPQWVEKGKAPWSVRICSPMFKHE